MHAETLCFIFFLFEDLFFALQLSHLSLFLLSPKSMRIRNRSLSFSAVSTPLTLDLPVAPETKQGEDEKTPKPEEEEEEEGKVHLNGDFLDKNQLHLSCNSSRPPEKDRSPSWQDKLRQINCRISQHGCRSLTEGSSCMLPDQEDWATAEEVEGDETWSANNKRSNKPGALTARLLLPSQGARWSEGESSYPLKKRKRNYGFMFLGSVDKTKKKKKTKHTEEDSNGYDDHINNRVNNVKKVNNINNGKNSNGNVVEGSRCSRVNGRGWRCSQATLVGYSLCEHHLGKGRLKSINNNNTLRRRSSSSTGSSSKGNGLCKQNKHFLSEQHGLHIDEDEEEEEEKEKKKAGKVVKARSINSLLGQLHQTAPNMLS